MICSPALKTKTIPTCTQELVVGTIADVSSALVVAIKDITTERLEIIQGESDGDGLVTIDISGYHFAPNHAYELWIFLAGSNLNDKKLITVEGGDCDSQDSELIGLSFTDTYENTEEQFVVTSQTLEIVC